MGQARLPGGERWKASQRYVGHAPVAGVLVTPDWPPGARVAWNGRIGMFLRDADADQVELLIGSRTYRVRRADGAIGVGRPNRRAAIDQRTPPASAQRAR